MSITIDFDAPRFSLLLMFAPSFRAVTLGALSCAVLQPFVAHAGPLPAQAGDAQSPLPSTGSILRNHPLPSLQDEPHRADVPLIERRPPEDTPDTKGTIRLHVSRIVVDDVPERVREAVDAVVAPYRERTMTFAQLRDVAIDVTRVLLDHGESISYAYLPEQDIVDDVVHIAVMQGKLESATLRKNRSLLRDSVIERYLGAGLDRDGDVRRMQDQFGRLGDLPGVGTITPELSPGRLPGGTAMSIDVDAGERLTGAFVADNSGQRTTGRNRIGAQLGINSPLGLGDRLQGIAFFSPDFLQRGHDSDGGNTIVGRLSYDAPVGSRGMRLGAALTRVDYTVGGEQYRDSGTGGHATLFSVYGTFPLLRTSRNTLDVETTAEFKRLSDRTLDVDNPRSARAVTVQLSGSRYGAWSGNHNIVSYRVGVTGGSVTNEDDWNGAGTRGRYVKTTQQFDFHQRLSARTRVHLSLNAQQTTRNLDGSEKMSLGGPYAVRAYDNDMFSADSGYIVSAAVHAGVPAVPGLGVSIFYDHAHATVQKFSRRKLALTLAGVGAGIEYAFGKHATVSLSYAMRTTGGPGNPPKAMTWVSSVIRL
ncbi:ShlB/FhaC/HecB family hemolysin secretion/activation protein [Burkholderia territorii]|uniref:ShlB/FhaC/HecB family hemolysin secretion/activation protein n=1 Tax=Burkholderia territorii TaxID=1503055 RepID=A0A6L3NNG1_9BURK|nr:ShlB/FhaC/HecB family hemolysin secretion/activation protein [Burkholderia territorii]KAB0686464.1 ShlB/FhaC/HecB family hemolysin secretion/activation protein [Burkholderia territorii]MBM2775672.1 ShlB/FhaC/HecB family hemolysin secretion/activation protein [Burkholderia territorii]VWB70220.1 membrane protein [Burkholderia territorii]